MKIALACYPAVSIIHGGPLIQVLQTKAELEKLGIETELFDTWKKFDRKTIDLVHIFSANLGTFHLARVLNEYSIPYVTSSIFYTQHSPAYIKTSLAIINLLKKFKTGIWSDYAFTQQICNWSKAVLPNTTSEGNLLNKGLEISSDKIHVVPNGVEERFESADPTIFRKKYGIENFILNVGHIGPLRKNVLNLIKAVKTIDVPLVIIGKITKGSYTDLCLTEAKENKNIIIIDGMENSSEMLASAYAASNVFVLPSLFETPGIAALEAGLAGSKIVITPYGGTKDYFGTMAEYVLPNSIESIRDGIISALNKNKSDELKNHIRNNFLWKHVAQKTFDVYKKVI